MFMMTFIYSFLSCGSILFFLNNFEGARVLMILFYYHMTASMFFPDLYLHLETSTASRVLKIC